MNARIRLIQSIAAPIDEARTLVDLHHAEVLTTARPQIKAETLRQAAVDLIAACPDHGDADEAWMDCPCEIADELSRQADVAGAVTSAATSTPTPEAYPGELAMLRGLLGVLRVTAQHADMAEVQRLLTEHAADEQAAYAEAGDGRG